MLSNLDKEAGVRAYQPDRVVRVLSGLATGLYYLTWVFAVVTLVWMPVGGVLAARGYEPSGRSIVFGMGGLAIGGPVPDGRFRIAVPVRLAHPRLTLPALRGGGVVEVSEVRATASVPMSVVSTPFVVSVWVALAVLLALVLLFLRQLRRLFQRLRQGAPFEPENAARLKGLGIVLLAASVWGSVTDSWMSVAVSRMLVGSGNDLGTGLYLNVPVIFIALVLIALAEIFRRGAALEDEQALVV